MLQAQAEVQGTPDAPAQAASQSGARTRSAGRGVLSITGAKLYFILTGYAVQILLPRLLGSPESFGLYSSAMNVVSILNNVMIAATVQTVSKHVSEDLPNAAATLRQGLLLQLLIAGLLGGSLWVISPVLAGRVLLDPALGPLLATAAIVVFCYGPYAALVGSLNGRQRFLQQAGLDATYTTLRSAGILGAAALGLGALGAIRGFAGAAASVLVVALLVVGIGSSGHTIAWRRWLLFMLPLWLYQLCLSLALQVDLSVLKSTVAALARESGTAADLAAETASRLAGFYRAAQTFAFVPYQLILSVTFVVFPMVSHAVSIGDAAATRSYIRAAMRFSLIVLLAIAAPVSGAANGVMRVAYPDAYLAGSDALAVLSLGMVCFALFVVAATVLSGAGRPGLPAAIALGMVALVVGGDLALLRLSGISEHTLRALALGTSFGMAVGLLAVATVVIKRFGTFIDPWALGRILFSGAVGWSVAHLVPATSALLALLALVSGGLAFVVALLLTGELGRADLEVVRRVVRR